MNYYISQLKATWTAVRRTVSVPGLVALIMVGLASAQEPIKIPTNEALGRVVSKVPPVYPAAARQLGVSGTVHMKVLISEEGTVEEVSTVDGNPMLAHAASDVLKEWKFTPYKGADGKPIKVSSVLALDFKL